MALTPSLRGPPMRVAVLGGRAGKTAQRPGHEAGVVPKAGPLAIPAGHIVHAIVQHVIGQALHEGPVLELPKRILYEIFEVWV